MGQKHGLHGESGLTVTIGMAVWNDALSGLHSRSAGTRESAGIFLGTASPNGAHVVSEVVFHHQLGDDRATALSLELPEAAKFQLYQHAARRHLTLVSLIHTHPYEWVGLSEVDQRNRISATVGFWSIVVPHYGRPPWHFDEMGFHVLEHSGWRMLTSAERSARFHVEV